MNKKLVLVLLMATMLAGGAFAQIQLSAGGGVILAPSFSEAKVEIMGVSDSAKSTGFHGGVNGFFDITYAEFNVALLFGNDKGDGADKGNDSTTLSLGVVGKYPIAIGDKMKIFPMAGINYHIILAAKNEGEEVEGDLSDNNYLGILLGVGFDFDISDSMYFRAEAGYEIGLNSKYEDDYIDLVEAFGGDVTFTKGAVPIKLAVGFRF